MPLTESEFKAEYSEKVEELRRQIKERDTRIQAYRREHGKLQLFFDDVKNLIEPIQEREPIIFPKRLKKGTLVEPVMHITDTHNGAVQEPNEIEGFNAYNPDIAHERSVLYATKWLKWVQDHSMAHHVENATVIITGDLISGDIHDELRITNAYPSPEQVVRSAMDIALQISMIAPYFKRVTIEFITEDNHSRLTKKPQAKEAGLNSLNYLVGTLIQSYISNLSNVKMNIYPMLEKVICVNERQYLTCHGHNVRGWMGVPWYGIERKVGKEAQARLQLIMQEVERAKEIGFHRYIFGHFHTPIFVSLYIGGASLQGTDAYDHQAGRYSGPAQGAWFVHPKNGEFDYISFDLA